MKAPDKRWAQTSDAATEKATITAMGSKRESLDAKFNGNFTPRADVCSSKKIHN